MNPTVVVPPEVEPVSLPEAKLWCKVEGTEEDALISSLIIASREMCEWRKGYAFLEQTLEVVYSGWQTGSNRIVLPRATPLQSIESVIYTDSTGAHTVEDTNYGVDALSSPGGIYFVEGYTFPSADVYAVKPIAIRYVVGQAAESAVPFPESIKLAMRLLIEHWYKNREAVVIGSSVAMAGAEMPLGVEALLNVNQQIYAF